MIGQKKVLNQIDNLIERGFPRFVIITGEKGQGKTEVAKYIYDRLSSYHLAKKTADNIYMIEIGIKIEDIRNMIEMAYKQTGLAIYLITNADKMSLGAKNSLLKVIEEPPNNAYFIMELQQIENTLDTIKSRCQEIRLDWYRKEELLEFIDTYYPSKVSEEDRLTLLDICHNKYQIDLMIKYGISEFYSYVEKVFNHIHKVQSANSFKIADKLDLKGNDEGYDLLLFWNAYRSICHKNIIEVYFNAKDKDTDKLTITRILGECIYITMRYTRKLKTINGINKQSLMDMWILDIRKAYR